MVAEINPPMMATAIGPQKLLRDKGIIASTAASAVNTIGRKTFLRQPDGRCQRTRQSEFSVAAGNPVECGRFAGNAGSSGTIQRRLLFRLAVLVHKECARGPRRRGFASIYENVDIV